MAEPADRSAGSKAPLRRRRNPGPPDVANWITAADWTNTTGTPITRLTTTWVVPPPPPKPSSQLIYLFNGLEPADGSYILQPVLQWGDYGKDSDGQQRTGPFWTAASWLVGGPTNAAWHSPHVRVNPGDVLVGSISLVSQTAAGFFYTAEFVGLPDTLFANAGIDRPLPELTWCCQTLEAYELEGNRHPPYDLDSGLEYPNADSVALRSISVTTANAPGAGPYWRTWNYAPIKFGEKTTVTQDRLTGGEVVISFRPAATVV
jgi:hypothetical protein